MNKIIEAHRVVKPVLAIALFVFFLLLFVIEIVTFPIIIINKGTGIRIMNWYNKKFAYFCTAILKIGNKNAIEIVDRENNPIHLSPGSSSSILMVSNHICAMDTVLLGMVSNALGKNARFIAKDRLKWVPVLGWGMYLSDYLFIKRSWAVDAERIKQWCFNQKTGTSLIIYPEGTRYTEKKREYSVNYSRKNNLPVFKNVLYPRTKGYIQCISSLQNPPFSTLINVTIFYLENGKHTVPPSIIACMMRRVPGVFKVIVEKKEIKKEVKSAEYLLDIFHEKDRVIEGYKKDRIGQAR